MGLCSLLVGLTTPGTSGDITGGASRRAGCAHRAGYRFAPVADERVHDEAARYRELVHVLDEGVVFQDRTGTVVAANDAAGRILGVAPDDLIGSTANDPRFSAAYTDGSPLQPDEHPPNLALVTGEPQSNVIMHVRRPDGVYVWLSVNARPVFEEGGTEPTGVVLSFTDITGQRDFEAQRMESLGRLARASSTRR